MRTKHDADKLEIGSRIKKLRIELGLSQKELAERVGYDSENSRSTINKVEAGINDIVQTKLPVYAAALNTTVQYLLFGTDSGIESKPATDMWDEQYNKDNCLQKEVSVIEAVEAQYGKGAVEMLHLFTQLNSLGKTRAIDALSDLTDIEKYTKKYTKNEAIHLIKKAARNGSFEEKAITDSELEEIKKLPNVDDLE